MKQIIHMKIPMVENSKLQDDFALSMTTIATFAQLAHKAIPEGYTLLVTPFDCECVDGDAKVITIDCKEYSYNELKEIVGGYNGKDRK